MSFRTGRLSDAPATPPRPGRVSLPRFEPKGRSPGTREGASGRAAGPLRGRGGTRTDTAPSLPRAALQRCRPALYGIKAWNERLLLDKAAFATDHDFSRRRAEEPPRPPAQPRPSLCRQPSAGRAGPSPSAEAGGGAGGGGRRQPQPLSGPLRAASSRLRPRLPPSPRVPARAACALGAAEPPPGLSPLRRPQRFSLPRSGAAWRGVNRAAGRAPHPPPAPARLPSFLPFLPPSLPPRPFLSPPGAATAEEEEHGESGAGPQPRTAARAQIQRYEAAAAIPRAASPRWAGGAAALRPRSSGSHFPGAGAGHQPLKCPSAPPPPPCRASPA